MGWFQTLTNYSFAIVPAIIMEYVLVMTYNSLIETYSIPESVVFFLIISIPIILLLLFALMIRQIRDEPPYEGRYMDF